MLPLLPTPKQLSWPRSYLHDHRFWRNPPSPEPVQIDFSTEHHLSQEEIGHGLMPAAHFRALQLWVLLDSIQVLRLLLEQTTQDSGSNILVLHQGVWHEYWPTANRHSVPEYFLRHYLFCRGSPVNLSSRLANCFRFVGGDIPGLQMSHNLLCDICENNGFGQDTLFFLKY